MNIFFDIGHPGHVHYFKNTINNLRANGHSILITARNRDVIFELLEKSNLPYFNRGGGRNSKTGKLIYMLYANIKLLFWSFNFKPDLFVSFSSPYAAQIAKIINKPHIALNDTEHTDKIHQKFTYPFSSIIITPKSYSTNLGRKHIKFDNIIEGLYLHTNYFTPNVNIYKDLGLKENEKFVLLRFVSWQAHHDYGQSGLNEQTISQLIKTLEKKHKVFISSELSLPEELDKYKLKVSPEKMHDVLYYASIFIGESGTMTSESAYLGTPAVYINSLPLMCYLRLEQDYGILKHFTSSIGVLDYVNNLLQDSMLKQKTIRRALKMKEEFIDPTAFLTWFIEEYPRSIQIMKENPDYQNRFK